MFLSGQYDFVSFVISYGLLHKICTHEKEMIVHYILQPTRKSSHSYARSGTQLLNISSITWCPVTSISKSHVLTARAHENCFINTCFSFHSFMAVNIV